MSGHPFEQLAGGRLFQIGIVVPDIRKSLDLYTKALGLGPWIGFHFTPENVQDFTYRGKPAEYSIEIAMTTETHPQVELVQVYGETSLYHEWIDRCGYGLQHLGVLVEDMEQTTREMKAAGYDVVQSGHGYGAAGDGAFTYYDTVDDFGVLLECIQVPSERRTPDFEWPGPE
jgi:catechol 2,3-dioxygenase-like lactoylglutathione lyase family enzyme